MKAMHIMVFLLILNLSIVLVGSSHIYKLETPAYQDMTIINPQLGEGGEYTNTSTNITGVYNTSALSQSSGENIITRFLPGIVSGIMISIAGASILAYFTRLAADKIIVYGLFVGTFWGITINAFVTLYNMFGSYTVGNEAVAGAIYTMFGIMGAITGIFFVFGFMQMVTGGWKAYI